VVRFKLARLATLTYSGMLASLDLLTFLRRAALSGLLKTLDALSAPLVVRRNIGSPGGSRPIQPLA
jgi:hypothetical protein